MDDKPIVAVLIPTHNNIVDFKVSIESILNQSYGKENIRIIVVDNASTDGTYELALEYLKAYADIVGIYRLAEETKHARVIKKAFELLSEQKYAYSTIVLPGNEIYEEYIERCIFTLKKYSKHNPKFLITEVDIKDESGKIKKQDSMYAKEEILFSKQTIKEFLIKGISHKVQIFYSDLPFYVTTRLKIIFDTMPNTDWYSIGYYLNEMGINSYIYLNDVLGCVVKDKLNDKIYDLMKRFTILKTLLFFIDRDIKKIDNYDKFDITKEEYCKAYISLSNLALYYACSEYRDNRINIAKKCLWFAESVEEKIVNDKKFKLITEIINSEKRCEIGCELLKNNEISIAIESSL